MEYLSTRLFQVDLKKLADCVVVSWFMLVFVKHFLETFLIRSDDLCVDADDNLLLMDGIVIDICR